MANTRDAKIAYFKSSELESEACLSLPLPVHNVQKRESKVSFLLHKHSRLASLEHIRKHSISLFT